MNRRGFFASLAALGGAVSLSPHIFIPKFEAVKWKRSVPQGITIHDIMMKDAERLRKKIYDHCLVPINYSDFMNGGTFPSRLGYIRKI